MRRSRQDQIIYGLYIARADLDEGKYMRRRQFDGPWFKFLEVEVEISKRILIAPFFVELRHIFGKDIAKHDTIIPPRILCTN